MHGYLEIFKGEITFYLSYKSQLIKICFYDKAHLTIKFKSTVKGHT